MILNRNSTIFAKDYTVPVQRASANLRRDLDKVCRTTEKRGAEIRLLIDKTQQPECFCIVSEDGHLEIRAAESLGFMYGIYEISRSILGVTDFWFWNDQKFIPEDEIYIADDYKYQSKPYRVRFRGWFVNDEVLIHKWSVDQKKEKPWEAVFSSNSMRLEKLSGRLKNTETKRGCLKKVAANSLLIARTYRSYGYCKTFTAWLSRLLMGSNELGPAR
jgi:hypothetical protein